MVTIALDEKVKKRILEDFSLFLAWIERYSFIDSALDPTHNKDWVAQQKQKEEKQLENLIREINCRKRMFKTMRMEERRKLINDLTNRSLEENKIKLG